VTFERLEASASLKVPDFKRLIIAGADQISTISRPGYIAYAELMANDCLLIFAVSCAPDFYLFIGSYFYFLFFFKLINITD
jgi:hypothetical protein